MIFLFLIFSQSLSLFFELNIDPRHILPRITDASLARSIVSQANNNLVGAIYNSTSKRNVQSDDFLSTRAQTD